MSSAFKDNSVGDEEEGEATEDIVSPFVARLNQGADKAGDNHNFIDEDGVNDGGSWKTTCQEKVKQQEWGGDDPVDVSNIKDLSQVATDLGVGSLELDLDGSPAEVRAHGEVGNRGNQGDGSGDVVEEALRAWLGEGQTHEDSSRHHHHCGDSEVLEDVSDG